VEAVVEGVQSGVVVTPEDRAAEEAARIERAFRKKLPHELRHVKAPDSMVLAPVAEADERALPFGIDMIIPNGRDASEAL
jgi:hypothetical protein